MPAVLPAKFADGFIVGKSFVPLLRAGDILALNSTGTMQAFYLGRSLTRAGVGFSGALRLLLIKGRFS